MREPIRDKNRLQHILQAIDTILDRIDGVTFDDLTNDKMLFGGIVYYTLIIGEAAYKLSKPFTENNPQVNWRDISDMRHHLVHGYYQVDSNIVWAVIHNDLRPLRQQVIKLLNETDWEQWEQNNES